MSEGDWMGVVEKQLFNDRALAPAARASDPDTSLVAALLPGRAKQRRVVLDALSWGECHDERLAERCRPLITNDGSVVKRRGELVFLGLAEPVVYDGEPLRVPTRTGSPSQVYRITQAGQDLLRAVKFGEGIE